MWPFCQNPWGKVLFRRFNERAFNLGGWTTHNDKQL